MIENLINAQMHSLRNRNLKAYFFFLLVMLAGLMVSSCHTSGQFTKSTDKAISRQWTQLNPTPTGHTGLAIYNTETHKWIFSKDADHYFIPASNVKILTMYTTLFALGEHLNAAYYSVAGDSLIFWGGGDPGTLYPNVDSSAAFIDFITHADKNIFFSNAHFRAPRYGAGWAWDDYPFSFQCERTAYPVYGNRINIDRLEDNIFIHPSYLKSILHVTKDTFSFAGKSEWGDEYRYTYDSRINEEHRAIPITFFRNDIEYCWSEVTGKEITIADIPMKTNIDSIEGTSRDALLKIMMQESDNFVSEQLLLACSLHEFGYMSDDAIIKYMLKGPLSGLQDSMVWVDGSGLSRYNLVTPRSLVSLLKDMLDQKGLDYLKRIFPAGGQTGTIKNAFAGQHDQPYIYAKSGSLRDAYNLSGYLVTRSGKVLIFSWMNNQCMDGKSAMKSKMDELLSFLYDHY